MNKGISRRGFCHWLVWLFPAGIIATATLIKDSRVETFNDQVTYGYINAQDGDATYYKVYLNGEDVSWQAFEADDREGFVGIYEGDANGSIVWALRPRRIYGKVRIVPVE